MTKAGSASAAGADADYIRRVGELVAELKARFTDPARVAVIAGSGLGGFSRSVEVRTKAPYDELPHVGASTVAGHAGALVLGEAGGVPLFLFQGRRHPYEGLALEEAVILLRALLTAFPVGTVVISNAAGGLNPLFEVGDLMLIRDQVNWMFRNPLRGQNVDEWGPRFPDASALYSPRLRVIAREAALEEGIPLREGVYVGGLGPNYETRAEVAMLRHAIGGDAVGMSTVHETLTAAHMGREVLGISFISNLLTVPAKTTHDEVMENSRLVEARFSALVMRILRRAAGGA